MKYLSLFSGVEAATLAWAPLGWEPVAFAEFDAFPSAVLAHRYPNVPNLGDVTQIDGTQFRGTVDLIVGGSPCQGFSVAGKQKGLEDPRSKLALAYVRLLDEVHPKWFVWENVPGVLSTRGGADFREFMSALTRLGYKCAWRILDAQHVRIDGYPNAIPQRRRRIFVVGHLDGWRYPAEVLFEREGVRGDSATRGSEGKDTTASLGSRLDRATKSIFRNGGFGKFTPENQAFGTVKTTNEFNGGCGDVCAEHFPRMLNDVAPTLTAESLIRHCQGAQESMGGKHYVYDMTHADEVVRPIADGLSPTLQARMGTGGNQVPIILPKAIGFSESGFAQFTQTQTAGPVRSAGGTVGSGGETLVSNTDEQLYATSLSYGIVRPQNVCPTLTAQMDNQTDLPLVANHAEQPAMVHENQRGTVSLNSISCPLMTNGGKPGQDNPVVLEPTYSLAENTIGRQPQNGGNGAGYNEEISYTLNTVGVHGVTDRMRVRRLTPVECERLMGFPDGYTKIPYRGKPAEQCPDAPRYKACGNSMCVNVMRWIGWRIQQVEQNGLTEP